MARSDDEFGGHGSPPPVVQRAATVLEDIHSNKHIRRMVWEKLAAKDTRFGRRRGAGWRRRTE
uniref:Uncharacterized protein n=1 Tax=Oryza glumipatula TaxID=40148 RepID=A0A0D9YCQ2_9ORYZ